MVIIYDEFQKGQFRPIPYDRIPATRKYVEHYSNYLFLQFISTNTKDRDERLQALKELTICERKLEWFKRHRNWNQDEALRQVNKLKRNWTTR